jgi:NAD(P)-dependent dehydrogenase (short-subunit alcohol dehydrogenase family)
MGPETLPAPGRLAGGKPKPQAMNLSRKVAIITGSSKGIGRAIARRLGQEGARIVLNGRDPEHLDHTLSILRAEGLEVLGFQGDISDEKVCLNMVDFAERNFGRIDILVNNAGISAKGFFEDLPSGIFLKLIQTNVIGGLNVTRAALPQLKTHQGSVLFISSLAGLRGIPHQSPYSLTKMAQTAVAETLRAELFSSKVHVGIIYVGITENDPDKKIFFSDGTWRNLENGMKQLGDSQERVAQAVLRAIRKRQFKTTVGWKGKTYFLISKYLPSLLDYTYCHHLDFIEQNDS